MQCEVHPAAGVLLISKWSGQWKTYNPNPRMPHQNDPTPPGHRKEKTVLGGTKRLIFWEGSWTNFQATYAIFWARASGDIGFSLWNSRELGFRCPDLFEIN
jgi:hypothetical protein